MQVRAYNRDPQAALNLIEYIEGSMQRREMAVALGLPLVDEERGIDLRFETIFRDVNDTLKALGGICVVMEDATSAQWVRLVTWLGPNEQLPPGQHAWLPHQTAAVEDSLGFSPKALLTDIQQEYQHQQHLELPHPYGPLHTGQYL